MVPDAVSLPKCDRCGEIYLDPAFSAVADEAVRVAVDGQDCDGSFQQQIEDIAERLRPCERIVWLTGAGISVASGIAPYRHSAAAVWENFTTSWGTIRRFREDPVAWWSEYWLKAHGNLATGGYEPNAAHVALTQAILRRPDDVLVTQNIDGLHRAAGVPEERLFEVHGRHDRFCCTNMRCQGFREPFRSVALGDGIAPRCERCRAHLRPVVLLFDEEYASHPLYRWDEARRAIKRADAIVFVGTSFAVGATKYAYEAARGHRAPFYLNINTEPAGAFMPGAKLVHDLIGRAEDVLPPLTEALLR